MPATTPRGFPYPLPTEPVAEGAQAIRNLAEAVDAKDAGRELAYAEVTAPVSVVGANNSGLANSILLVGLPAVIFDGSTPAWLEFFCPRVDSGAVAGHGPIIALYEATSAQEAGRLGQVFTPAAAQIGVPVLARRRIVPAAGSRVFRALAWMSSTTPTATFQAGAGALDQWSMMYLRMTRA